jgi:hypothetical protein
MPDEPRRRRPADDDDPDDRPRRRRPRDDDAPAADGGVGYVIPYKNGSALAAYYIGVFGLILCLLPPLSLFSGGTAIVLGFMGMNRAKQNPQAHGRGHAITGIVLGALQVLTACGVAITFIVAIMLGGRR